MGFAGELATIGLPEVFHNLAFSRLSGVLSVRGDGVDAALLLEDGLIRAFRAGGARALDYEVIAERSGAAPPATIDDARARPRRQTLRDTLLNSDSFREDQFDAGVSEAVTEEILLLFGNLSASFKFEEGSADAPAFDAEQLACNLAIDPEAIAEEAGRRLDEWHTISSHIGSLAEIYVAVAEPEAIERVSPEERAILQCLDGTQDLRTALDPLPYDRLDIMRLVSDMIQRGLVRSASTEHLRELASRCAERGEINRAAQLLIKAMENTDDVVSACQQLVDLYENAGRLHDAAESCKRLAEAMEARGDVQGATEAYARSLRHAPHDVEAHERITAIHDARGDRRAAHEAGRRLAETHASQGRNSEALVVLQDLLARSPGDIGLREAIAATYIKMHEPQNAAQELLSLAESASAANGYHRALHYYRSVLAVDRSCSVAAACIDEMEADRAKVRRRARRRRVVCGFAALILALGTWQGARELFAQEALNNAARATAGRDAATTLEHYSHVTRAYPMTLGARHAEELLRAIVLEELHRSRRSGDADALKKLRRINLPDEIKDLWRNARAR